MRRLLHTPVLAAIMVFGVSGLASAQSLTDLLPELIAKAAVIAQPISPANANIVDANAVNRSQSFLPATTLTTVPATLNAAMALQLGTFPLGPTAGTVIYSRDGVGPAMHQMFGAAYADRGVPLGRGKVGLAMTFQNDEYSTFDGVDLNGGGVNFLFANAGPAPDLSDVLQETVSYRLNRKVTSFLIDYGATSRLDVSAVVPIVQVAMDVRVSSRIVRVRSSLDNLLSCATVPARNAGNGVPLHLCQDPHGYDNILTLGTHITYLDLDLNGTLISQNNYGVSGKTARGIGDLQLRGKYAVIATPSTALAATIDLGLPTGNTDDFLGSGAVRAKPGIAWSAAVGRVSPHVNAGYTFSSGSISAKLQTTPATLDLKVPNEINWAAGLDAAVAPRTTLVVDVIGRTVKNVQRFDTGSTIFATGAPGVPSDVAAATDLIPNGRGDITQAFGTIGGRINLSGSIFANGSVMFPVTSVGLKPRTSAVFWIDYGF